MVEAVPGPLRRGTNGEAGSPAQADEPAGPSADATEDSAPSRTAQKDGRGTPGSPEVTKAAATKVSPADEPVAEKAPAPTPSEPTETPASKPAVKSTIDRRAVGGPAADRAAGDGTSRAVRAGDGDRAADRATRDGASAAGSDEDAAVSDEPERVVLRGAAARTVANMDASLTVPTATSVRAVPVKLLIDNRIVINNHLARARGGKVWFTHLIGYAMVRALRAMPEMNNGFEVRDGKPTLVSPSTSTSGSRST